jgi:1-deoxyxylulose-5-phosphate synthase
MTGDNPSTSAINDPSHIPGVEKQVSRLILGSAIFAPPKPEFVFSMLDEYVRLGGTTLETAHSYGCGDCERVIGKWLTERGLREKIVLITKGGHPFDGRSRMIPECIDADLSESLVRLKTDYIDIYMLHRDDPSRPVDEIVECLAEHHKAGEIRAYGGSNWKPERLQAANEYAKKRNLPPFVVSSPHFSLAAPHVEPWPGCIWVSDDDRNWYKNNDLPMIAWSSQARGFFARGISSVDELDEGDALRAWLNADNFERLKRARALGQQRGFSANAVALAYVISQKFTTFAAIGPASIDELHDSFSALGCDLTDAEMSWLNLEGPSP